MTKNKLKGDNFIVSAVLRVENNFKRTLEVALRGIKHRLSSTKSVAKQTSVKQSSPTRGS